MEVFCGKQAFQRFAGGTETASNLAAVGQRYWTGTDHGGPDCRLSEISTKKVSNRKRPLRPGGIQKFWELSI